MKVLVANHWMKKMGGSETWCYTMIEELIRQQHDVSFFTLFPGIMSNKIKGIADCEVLTLLNRGHSFDLVLANHNSTVDHLHRFEHGKIIQTCHGVYPALEQPSYNACYHVSISKEVSDHLQRKGFNSAVIHNPVDLYRFRPKTKISEGSPRRVLSLAHGKALNYIIEKEFAKYGIEFTAHNKYSSPVFEVEDLINRHDMVVSLGRGCYEALACGRPVLVLDHRDKYMPMAGDGFLTDDNFMDILEFNCSGRAFKRTDIPEMVKESIDQYSEMPSEACRFLAESFFDVKLAVKKYTELWLWI